MKKVTALSTVFLFVFGLTAGIVTVLNEDAMAGPYCPGQCEFERECSFDTGPLCSGNTPYYAYWKSACTGGPYNCPYVNEFLGCWTGVEPCITKHPGIILP